VVVLPELAVTGYPPEDLVLKPAFVRANHDAVQRIAAATGEVLAVFGFVDSDGSRLYNAAAMCHRGRLVGVYRKQLLPNYGVFDEDRYFEPGTEHILLETGEGILGV
jgi:NAD+ synthase (glutamine-hydrolysing)